MKLFVNYIHLLSFFTVVTFVTSLPNQIKVGILLHENQNEQQLVFIWSLEQVNQRSILNRTKLFGIVKKVTDGDSWDAERKACELLEEGVVAIVGPTNFRTSQHVGSICDALDIPHLNVVTKGITYNSQPTGTNIIVDSTYPRFSAETFQSPISVDLSISQSVLTRAHLDLLNALNWKSFIYLYEQDDSLFSLQEHFDGKSLKTSDLSVKIIRFDSSRPYRDVFWELKTKTNIKHIMLDVNCSNLKTILKHAQQVSMMTEAHSYLLVCLDTQTMDLEDFKYSRTRILWLNSCNPMSFGSTSPSEVSIFMNPNLIKTESALIHDAIETFTYALQGVDSTQYISKVASLSCSKSKPWQHGSTIVNHMRASIEINGMSGKVKFDNLGQRFEHVLNVAKLTVDGPKIVGNWSQSLNSTNSISIDKLELQYLQKGDLALYASEQRDLLIVTSILNKPYFMNRQTTQLETGNARFEGYAIDLIDELSRIVGFDYEFKEVDDENYGKFDEEKKEWNGMIREVMTGKADLALADLSITSSREDAVDFTLPFMSTGISILFKKPTTKELELFSFLSPFEKDVWVYVCGAYIGVSLLLFIVGRISPYEWADPHPCRREDKILRNQFSVTNSFWFTIAAVMQQGSDLAPRSLSTRLVAAIWYFFTLIMISSYTANLAAFLTVEKVVYPIEKAEDLYKHPQNIKYGCVESGSTGTFFQKSKPHSTFSKMYAEMVFVQGNEQGISEVEKGNYAFFMESSSIEFYIERKCNLTQIGGLLDSKGYGIAIAKNSTRKRDYRTKLSEGILSLQESGTLEVLKNRWWKEKRGGGACDIDESQGEGVKELTLANVGGVFVVLGIGITISFVLCALELYAKSCRLAAAQGTNKWIQARRRIEFSLSFSDNY